MKLSIQQVVKDESSLVLFKVRLKTLAKKLGFKTVTIESMQIVANEMLSNQIKYSNNTGMVQLWFHSDHSNKEKFNNNSPVTIDIFAMDYGPGIKNLKQASKDGYSTSKTMGKGLGSISRMAHESGVFTIPEHKTEQTSWHGVACWSRFYCLENEKPVHFQYGLFCRAYHNMAHNGDDLWLKFNAKEISCLHLDATGHGQEAEAIVSKVRQINAHVHGVNVEKMLDITQQTLATTAGAAVVALKYHSGSRQGEYCAVGDMRLFEIKINDAGNQQINDLEVCSGILGNASRSYSRRKFKLKNEELIISLSDGIRRNWKLTDFADLWNQHPQLICFFLGNKKGRNSDDQSILALKNIKQPK